MDVTLVARGPLDRWALVAGLGLSPADAHDLDSGLARIVHPSTDVRRVVLLVRSAIELTWLRRLRRSLVGPSSPVVTAIVSGGIDAGHARRAGADAVVVWADEGDDDSLARAVEEAVAAASGVTVLLPDVRTSTG